MFIVLVCCILATLASDLSLPNSNPKLNSNYFVANIHEIGFKELKSLKEYPGVNWWIEVGDVLLLSGSDLDVTLHAYGTKKIIDPNGGNIIATIDRVVVYSNSKHSPHELPDGLLNSAILLLRRGGFSIFHFKNQESMTKFDLSDFPFMLASPNLILIREYKNDEHRPEITLKADPQQMANVINVTRWFESDSRLAMYNRYTRGTDIVNAQYWIEQTIQAIAPTAVVSNEPFKVGSTNAYNIMVTFTGKTRPNDWYIVGAHYDSTSESPTTKAPGAEDNGSGSAGLIELIHALVKYPPAATVKIIFYSGEEQGCYGSTANVNALNAAGDASKVKLVIIMDMIGYAASSKYMVLLESYSRFNATLTPFAAAAETYGKIGAAFSYNPFGSDHMPYLKNGYTALLNIDYDYDSYPYYHKTTDTPNRLVPPMAQGILRTIAAVLGEKIY